MDQDLIDLISACKGEDVAPERRDQLLARLRDDAAFQQSFVDEIRMLGMLKAVQSMEPRWLRLQDVLGWAPEAPGAEARREDAFIEDLRGLTLRRSSRLRAWRAAAATAAVVLIGLTVPGFVSVWRPKASDPAPAASRVYPQVDAENGLAMVVNLDRVRWEDQGEPHPAEGDLLAAGRIRLRSGRATLSMLSGVVIVVEGPADFDLVSFDRVFCRRGNLRVRVPKGAEGLVVSSPSSSVLDLGTEFGLNVEAGGKSRVKVFEGTAEAVMRTGSGHENLSRYVYVNKAYELDPKAGRIEPVQGPGDFLAPLDRPTPSLLLDPSYRDTVLASRPWGYWRFESMPGGSIPNEVADRPALRATGPVGLSGSPVGNQSAVFKPGEDHQFFEMDGLWEPPPEPGYAAELWFLSEGIDHSSLISMPVPEDTNFHFFFLETGSRNRHAVHPPATVRFLDRWPPALGGGHNIYSQRRYIPNRWHHVVGQTNRGRMELYLDGEPTYSTPSDLSHPTAPCQVLLGRLSTIRLTQTDDSRWFHGRPFIGRLDEVALYDHPLSAAEVRSHHRLASQQVGDARPAAPVADAPRPVIRGRDGLEMTRRPVTPEP